MRVAAIVLGILLLVAGGAVVVIADQQRQSLVGYAEQRLDQAERRLVEARESNLSIAGVLSQLRSKIAEQDKKLSDATGFIR